MYTFFWEFANRGSSRDSRHLGRYSIFSLQSLDGFCFVGIVLATNSNAIIKTSKLELLLVQLDSKFVVFDIGNNSLLGGYTLDLERDCGAKDHVLRLTDGFTEVQIHLIHVFFIGSHMLGQSEGHRQGNWILASHLLLYRHAEHVNRTIIAGLPIG